MSKVVKEGTKNSKYAELDYEVLKYDPELNLSVLKINLNTGRHHQIRVQLSSRGHSIYGDQKYGGRGHGKQMGQHIKCHSHMAEQHDCVLIMLLRAI